MRITTLIVSLLLCGGFHVAAPQAQPLSEARPPAEFPPASYRGLQYVDSRGCVYVRAGIDGNVTWVPRVTRQRQQVCGFQPSLSPAELSAAGSPPPTRPTGPAPEQITLSPTTQPATTPSPPAPVAATPRQSQAPTPAAATPQLAQPAPQTAPPRAQPTGRAGDLPETTRVIRRHVAEARAGSQNIVVPKGYTRVWEDGRLNVERSIMTLKPSVVANTAFVPRGYRAAWQDGRLNRKRGTQAAAGDAAMAQLWSDTVPRRLNLTVGRERVVQYQDPAVRGNSPFWTPPLAAASTQPVTRLSSRSDSTERVVGPRFIRVAHYTSDADARQTVRALTQRGVPARLSQLKRGNEVFPLVLAGPFATSRQVDTALGQLRAVGFNAAQLLP